MTHGAWLASLLSMIVAAFHIEPDAVGRRSSVFGHPSGFAQLTELTSQTAGTLIERTLAIVGGQAVTLSEAETARALGLIEVADDPDVVGAVAAKLVDRLLVLREVQRYVPPEPALTEIDARLAAVSRRFSTADEFARTLDAGGFSEARLREWIRDDLRIAAYLGQRFAAVGVPSNDEVSAYFLQHRAEFERTGRSFDAAAPAIRERLSAERRAELIADWTADLRRRTPVVMLWKKP